MFCFKRAQVFEMYINVPKKIHSVKGEAEFIEHLPYTKDSPIHMCFILTLAATLNVIIHIL